MSSTIPPNAEIKDHAGLWKYSDAVHRLYSTNPLSDEEETAGAIATAEYNRILLFVSEQKAKITSAVRFGYVVGLLLAAVCCWALHG